MAENCPFCDTKSSYESISDRILHLHCGDLKCNAITHYFCPHCGDFVIERLAEEKLKEFPANRASILDWMKKPREGKICVTTLWQPGNGTTSTYDPQKLLGL